MTYPSIGLKMPWLNALLTHWGQMARLFPQPQRLVNPMPTTPIIPMTPSAGSSKGSTTNHPPIPAAPATPKQSTIIPTTPSIKRPNPLTQNTHALPTIPKTPLKPHIKPPIKSPNTLAKPPIPPAPATSTPIAPTLSTRTTRTAKTTNHHINQPAGIRTPQPNAPLLTRHFQLYSPNILPQSAMRTAPTATQHRVISHKAPVAMPLAPSNTALNVNNNTDLNTNGNSSLSTAPATIMPNAHTAPTPNNQDHTLLRVIDAVIPQSPLHAYTT